MFETPAFFIRENSSFVLADDKLALASVNYGIQMIVAFVGLFQSNILELMSVDYERSALPFFLPLSPCSQMLNNRTLDTADPFFRYAISQCYRAEVLQ